MRGKTREFEPREFGVGERVWVNEYGYGLVREAIGNKGVTDYVRIIFENDPTHWACWLFTAERVIKESEVSRDIVTSID